MNDEWKMPGTEQEENQQPVGEEMELTRRQLGKRMRKPQKRNRQKRQNLQSRMKYRNRQK